MSLSWHSTLFFLVLLVLCVSIAGAQETSSSSSSSSTSNFRVLQEGEPLPVLVSIVLRELSDVSDTTETFVADFYLALRYQDPSALTPFNVTGSTSHVIKDINPTTYGISPLTLEYINGISGQQVYGVYDVFAQSSLTATETMEYDTIPVNVSWGWVELHLRYQGTFRSSFDLRSFPFDSQALSITFEDVNRNLSDIQFYDRVTKTTDLHEIKQPFGFELLNHVHESSSTYYQVFGESYAAHTFTIQLHRVSGAAFGVKIIGPLLVTTMLSYFLWCYNLMEDKRHIPQATMFLAVVTYMFVINLQLPNLPYTTRIDNFVLVSMLNNLTCFSWHALARWVGNSRPPPPPAVPKSSGSGVVQKNYIEAAMIAVDRPFCLVLLMLYLLMSMLTMTVDLEYDTPVGVYLSFLAVLVITMLSLGNGMGAMAVEQLMKRRGREAAIKVAHPGRSPKSASTVENEDFVSRGELGVVPAATVVAAHPEVLDAEVGDSSPSSSLPTVTHPFLKDPNRDLVQVEDEV